MGDIFDCHNWERDWCKESILLASRRNRSVHSVTESCPTLCSPMDHSTSFPVHHQLLEFVHTHVYRVGDAIQPSHPLSSPSSPAFSLPRIRVFSNESLFSSGSQSIGVSASALVLPMYIQDFFSFRMDWFDLLAVQGTLKSLLQHHSSKTSILLCSAFFIDQRPHPYIATGKSIALPRRTFVG